jgi:hypothetical protein
MFDAFQICKNTLAMEPSSNYVRGGGQSEKENFDLN